MPALDDQTLSFFEQQNKGTSDKALKGTTTAIRSMVKQCGGLHTPTAAGALGRWPKIAGEAALDLSGVELSQALGAVSTTHTKRARQLPASVSGLALEKGRRPVYPNQSGAPCDDRADFHSAQRH